MYSAVICSWGLACLFLQEENQSSLVECRVAFFCSFLMQFGASLPLVKSFRVSVQYDKWVCAVHDTWVACGRRAMPMLLPLGELCVFFMQCGCVNHAVRFWFVRAYVFWCEFPQFEKTDVMQCGTKMQSTRLLPAVKNSILTRQKYALH